MDLAVSALQRQSLAQYPQTQVANGVTVPGWLIVGSAGATAEAVLGLSAYSGAKPSDQAARTALAHYAEGIAKLQSGGVGQWPFGALLPEANSPTFWHAWAGMQPAALTAAAATCSVTAACRRRRPPTSPSSPRNCSRPAARTTAGRPPRPTAPRSRTESTPASRA